jgi:serine/threonine-protein kinase
MTSPERGETTRQTSTRPTSPVKEPSHYQAGFFFESGPDFTTEIVELLHRRLCWASLLALTLFSLFLLRDLFAPAAPASPLNLWRWIIVVAILAVVVGRLWSSRTRSLRELRILEVISVGCIAAFLAGSEFTSLNGDLVSKHTEGGHDTYGELLIAHYWALPWFAVLVVYGAFIPNTWMRCALVVGLLSTLPLGIPVAVAIWHPGFGAMLLNHALVEMTIWIGLAAGLAVYASHKIGQFRRKAFEAEKLGHYQLKDRLGSGGMGEVYLAEHQLLRRTCAVKLIRPEQAGNERNLTRFEREVKAMASLTHWNTVEIFDYGRTSDGTLYYVMEYLPGFDLQDLVERWGPLPPERVIHLLRQVCAGLEEAHAIGLVHRDIKPSNIMICRRGRVFDVVKLLDFGLVQQIAEGQHGMRVTVEGTILGTPLYMSPEQATGTDRIDSRSDIYSVGAVAVFLLTGRPLFDYTSVTKILAAHMMEPPPRLAELRPDLGPDLVEVVTRCLHKDPSRRFPTVEALNQALENCPGAGEWTQQRAHAWWLQSMEPRETTGPVGPLLSQTPPATYPG